MFYFKHFSKFEILHISNILRIDFEIRAKIQEHKLLIALFSVKSSYFFPLYLPSANISLKQVPQNKRFSNFSPIFQILMITILTDYI